MSIYITRTTYRLLSPLNVKHLIHISSLGLVYSEIISSVSQVGHAGTLDPLSTGLLIVCMGKATKLADRSVFATLKNF